LKTSTTLKQQGRRKLDMHFREATRNDYEMVHQLQKQVPTELYRLYHEKMIERHTTRKLAPNHRDAVISSLYDQIQSRDIWIPYDEIRKYTFSKTTKIVKSFKKHFPDLSEEIVTAKYSNK
jgi:hypothetical protein